MDNELITKENVEKGLRDYQPNQAFSSATALLPKSYEQMMKFAGIACASGLVPDHFKGKPEAAAAAVMYGLELGVMPMQALQNIMVVNGRPALWGDLVKGLVLSSGKCEIFDEDPPHIALAQGFGRCRLKRKDNGMEWEIQFSMEDAKRAGLQGKAGPWQQYPGRMLMFRARGWACRDLFPDVLKGMAIAEEMFDMEIIQPTPPAMPRRSKDVSHQDAQIVKPAEGATEAQTAATGENQAVSGEMANDAIQPGNAPGDEAFFDPLITEEQRKQLLNEVLTAKIDLKAWKGFCVNELKLKSSAEMRVSQLDEARAWILANSK